MPNRWVFRRPWTSWPKKRKRFQPVRVSTSTYTASAAVTIGAVTCSGSAQFTKPTYTGAGAVSIGAVTCSGNATFTQPSFTGAAAVTIGAVTCTGSAQFTKPTYTGTGTVSIGPVVCSGSATFTKPAYTGSGAVTIGATTCAGSGSVTNPTYEASAAVTIGSVTCTGSAIFAAAVYQASAAVSIGAVTCSGSATFTKPTYTGSGTVSIGPVTCSGAATFTKPTYTGSAGVSIGQVTCSGSASFTEPIYAGTSSVTIGATTGTGTATFSSSGGGPGPVIATLSIVDNGDGTATATVSGSSIGSFNTIYVDGPFDLDWVSVGSVSGDGTLTFNLSPGRYFGYVQSALNGQTSSSAPILFRMIGETEAMLNHSPADIVRHLLVDLGQGSLTVDDTEWPIKVAIEPDKPDNLITITDTSGMINGRAQYGGEVFEHHGIQVRLRAIEHSVGYAKLREIEVALAEQIAQDYVSIDAYEYKVWNVSRKGTVIALGTEVGASKRHLFTFNAVVSVRQMN